MNIIKSDDTKLPWVLLALSLCSARLLLDSYFAAAADTWLFALASLACSALTLLLGARMISRANVFSRSTRTSIVFLALLLVGFSSADTKSFALALLSMLSLTSINRATQQLGQLSSLFDAGFWMGILILLAPQALIFALGLLFAWLIFRRDIRRILLLVIGFSVPLSTYFATRWILDSSKLLTDLQSLSLDFALSANAWSKVDGAQIALSLFVLALAALASSQSKRLSLSSYGEGFVSMCSLWVLLALCLPFFKGFEAGMLSLAAAPAMICAITLSLSLKKLWRFAFLAALALLCLL